METTVGGGDRVASPSIPIAQIADFYRSMLRIRRVEEEIERIYASDKIKSPVHLSVGQEAASVGVCGALRPDDIVFATYRGHAAYLAKGGDMRRMVAELFGKADGCGAGRSGSMHLIDVAAGVMGTSAIVATAIPQAIGYGFALKSSKSDRVAVTFFGDGATEEGVFYESLNFAALKRLPVLFVCENNLYAINSHISARLANLDFCERARAHDMPAERVGNDILQICAAAKRAIDKIRKGEGPQFLEIETYRYSRHVGPGSDVSLGYRTQDEIDTWRKRDQVDRAGTMLDPATRKKIEAEVESEVRDAFDFAENAPFPDGGELLKYVFHG